MKEEEEEGMIVCVEREGGEEKDEGGDEREPDGIEGWREVKEKRREREVGDEEEERYILENQGKG